MATERREEGSYWRQDNRGGAMGGYHLPAMATMAALGPYQPAGTQSNDVDPDMFQLSYPRPRLRWTSELHDQFVEAINQLGGPQKATPKTIANLMKVEGITLFQIKSHLQKFRQGKTPRRFLKRDFVPIDFSRRRDESLPQVNLKAQGSPLSYNAHEVNGNKTLEAEKYGNLHLLVEPQTIVENMEMTKILKNKEAGSSINSEKEEEDDASKPALLPLFPEWKEILDEVDKKPVAPLTDYGPSMDDYLGYYSSEYALTRTYKSSRASTTYRSFFDEVASFSKVDYDDFTVGRSALAMEDDGISHNYL